MKLSAPLTLVVLEEVAAVKVKGADGGEEKKLIAFMPSVGEMLA